MEAVVVASTDTLDMQVFAAGFGSLIIILEAAQVHLIIVAS